MTIDENGTIAVLGSEPATADRDLSIMIPSSMEKHEISEENHNVLLLITRTVYYR